jgi:hypothetical protein
VRHNHEPMIARIAVLATVLALALAPAALAQGSPFAPLPPAQTDPGTTVQTVSGASNDGGGLKAWQEILIFAAGVVLIGGIGYAIVSDARERAPVKQPAPDSGPAGSQRPHGPEAKARARAKQKAARRQRRRNR